MPNHFGCKRQLSKFAFHVCYLQEALLAGQAVDCSQKGRLLHLCWQKANHTMDLALQECNSWSPRFFGNPMDLATELVGCVRLSVALGRRKMLWASELPYMLSRLVMPGVAAQALAAFQNHPEDQHHPVSIRILGAASPLRALVEGLPAAGGSLPTELARHRWIS